jgi:hypothetical protein
MGGLDPPIQLVAGQLRKLDGRLKAGHGEVKAGIQQR